MYDKHTQGLVSASPECLTILQTPRPHFPGPMGAAEFWGRFCYVEEGPFAAATAADLQSAWELATTAAIA